MGIKVWRWIFVSVFLFTILFTGLKWATPKQNEQDLARIKNLTYSKENKKIIVFMVDSLMTKSIDKGIKEGELPAIQFMIKNGQYYKQVVSSFPTMSVTIDSTLLTGASPSRHHLPGLVWYSTKENKIINYGTSLKELMSNGLNASLINGIIDLNHVHLNKGVSTIFEDLKKMNKTSGSINGLIYRGYMNHTLTFPAWITIPSTLPSNINVKGPDFLSFGALSNPLQNKVNLSDNVYNDYGFNNQYAVDTVKYLIKNRNLPDFLYVYLPDLDHELHKNGEDKANTGLKKFDTQLKSILDSYDSWEQALQQNIFVILGDSGQTKVYPAKDSPIIYLQSLLGNYRTLSSGIPNLDTQIVIAVNERMAYLYPLPPIQKVEMIDALKNDKRIDIIAQKNKDEVYVRKGGTDKILEFKKGTFYTDDYNQGWDLKGDYDVLDLTVNKLRKRITYGDYPDGLNRLLSALNSHDGDYLVVTAKPGYEFAGTSSPTHINGGAHGSMQSIDSLIPMIIAGTDMKPTHLRIVDMKDFILSLYREEKIR